MYTSAFLLSLVPVLLGSSAVATSTATASAASSSGTITVEVGNGGITFKPDSVTAAVGTKIKFMFYPENHSVAQSTFAKPCVPSGDTAFFSGFIPVATGETGKSFTMTVTNSNPIWLYCSQGQHCQAGMSMVINPPTSGANTLNAYKAAAKSVSASQSPSTITEEGTSTSTSSTSGTSTSTSASTTKPSSAAVPGTAQIGWGLLGAGLSAVLFAAGLV